ncbi:hypothetical protein A2U01_0088447, partial [Trifolium medium]|nr:hypothetical protein [Trifolium medium]
MVFLLVSFLIEIRGSHRDFVKKNDSILGGFAESLCIGAG